MNKVDILVDSSKRDGERVSECVIEKQWLRAEGVHKEEAECCYYNVVNAAKSNRPAL